jgi:hypothetical protein
MGWGTAEELQQLKKLSKSPPPSYLQSDSRLQTCCSTFMEHKYLSLNPNRSAEYHSRVTHSFEIRALMPPIELMPSGDIACCVPHWPEKLIGIWRNCRLGESKWAEMKTLKPSHHYSRKIWVWNKKSTSCTVVVFKMPSCMCLSLTMSKNLIIWWNG